MILVLDNYDSFTFNLVQGLQRHGAKVVVRQNDDPSLSELDPSAYDGVLLGPGPGRPEASGRLMHTLESLCGSVPILGVCLGMQALAVHRGAKVIPAPRPLHGQVAQIEHDGQGLFEAIPSPMAATRYHSLCVEPSTVPDDLKVSAQSSDGVIMGLRSLSDDFEGVQFHPESIASIHGDALLEAFVRKVS